MLQAVPDQTPDDISLHEAALDGGCQPLWRDGILGWGWHCGCPDNRHGADQQCSIITHESLARVRP
jgi:hypothetical protein